MIRLRLTTRPTCDGQHARLTVIVVNHESWPDVFRLTASLVAEPEFSSGQCRIVVVDNASTGTGSSALLNPPSGLRLVVGRKTKVSRRA